MNAFSICGQNNAASAKRNETAKRMALLDFIVLHAHAHWNSTAVRIMGRLSWSCDLRTAALAISKTTTKPDRCSTPRQCCNIGIKIVRNACKLYHTSQSRVHTVHSCKSHHRYKEMRLRTWRLLQAACSGGRHTLHKLEVSLAWPCLSWWCLDGSTAAAAAAATSSGWSASSSTLFKTRVTCIRCPLQHELVDPQLASRLPTSSVSVQQQTNDDVDGRYHTAGNNCVIMASATIKYVLESSV